MHHFPCVCLFLQEYAHCFLDCVRLLVEPSNTVKEGHCKFYTVRCQQFLSWFHNIQVLLDDGNRVTIPQGIFLFSLSGHAYQAKYQAFYLFYFLFAFIHVFFSQRAFGVLMWEVLTLGQQPYPARTNIEVLHYVRSGGRLDRPDSCPDELWVIFLPSYSIIFHCQKY